MTQPPAGPPPLRIPLRRQGTGGARLALPTAVASVFAVFALLVLASPPTGAADLFFVAVAAVPGVVVIMLWRQRLTPPPCLRIDVDGLVVEDPLTLVEPLCVPWRAVAEVRVGAGVEARLAATLGSVMGLPLPRTAEFGLDVGPAVPNLLLGFEPPAVPVRTRRVVVARGTRTMTPATGRPIDRLWLAAIDPAAANAAFAAVGRHLEEGD